MFLELRHKPLVAEAIMLHKLAAEEQLRDCVDVCDFAEFQLHSHAALRIRVFVENLLVVRDVLVPGVYNIL